METTTKRQPCEYNHVKEMIKITGNIIKLIFFLQQLQGQMKFKSSSLGPLVFLLQIFFLNIRFSNSLSLSVPDDIYIQFGFERHLMTVITYQGCVQHRSCQVELRRKILLNGELDQPLHSYSQLKKCLLASEFKMAAKTKFNFVR